MISRERAASGIANAAVFLTGGLIVIVSGLLASMLLGMIARAIARAFAFGWGTL